MSILITQVSVGKLATAGAATDVLLESYVGGVFFLPALGCPVAHHSTQRPAAALLKGNIRWWFRSVAFERFDQVISFQLI